MIFLHCISYIIWTSENFPKGGKDLANLLERCMTTFKDQERYKNDERYAKVWLRYVSIYLYLCCLFTLKGFSDAILKLAGFYTFWSSGSVKLQNTWPLVAPEKCCPWSCLISAGSKWSCTGERRRGADLKKASKKRGLSGTVEPRLNGHPILSGQ